jgi:Fe-S cluster assembly protein SufD
VMLSFGFINELINNVKSEPVGNYLRPKLTELFTVSPDLARHGL